MMPAELIAAPVSGESEGAAAIKELQAFLKKGTVAEVAAQPFAGVSLTEDEAERVMRALRSRFEDEVRAAAKAEFESKVLEADGGFDPGYGRSRAHLSAVQDNVQEMEAQIEAARLLTLKAAWMADNKLPNSKEASIAKAKAGRVANEVTLKCVELAGALGYGEDELLEKWARDSKILDIFEGTQQIQLLIVARRLLGKSSSELK